MVKVKSPLLLPVQNVLVPVLKSPGKEFRLQAWMDLGVQVSSPTFSVSSSRFGHPLC